MKKTDITTILGSQSCKPTEITRLPCGGDGKDYSIESVIVEGNNLTIVQNPDKSFTVPLPTSQTNLGLRNNEDSITILNSNGTSVDIPLVTTTTIGVSNPKDKAYLEYIKSNGYVSDISASVTEDKFQRWNFSRVKSTPDGTPSLISVSGSLVLREFSPTLAGVVKPPSSEQSTTDYILTGRNTFVHKSSIFNIIKSPTEPEDKTVGNIWIKTS